MKKIVIVLMIIFLCVKISFIHAQNFNIPINGIDEPYKTIIHWNIQFDLLASANSSIYYRIEDGYEIHYFFDSNDNCNTEMLCLDDLHQYEFDTWILEQQYQYDRDDKFYLISGVYIYKLRKFSDGLWHYYLTNEKLK